MGESNGFTRELNGSEPIKSMFLLSSLFLLPHTSPPHPLSLMVCVLKVLSSLKGKIDGLLMTDLICYWCPLAQLL